MNDNNCEKTKYLQYLLDKQLDWIQKSDTKASVLLSAIGVLFTLLINSRFYGVVVNCIHYLFIKDKIFLTVANYKFNPNKPGIFQWQSVDDVFLMVVD